MRATIEQQAAGPWAHEGIAYAPPVRHAEHHRSIWTWMHFVIDSLFEAHATHAAYRRQIEQGVLPGIAIREAFKQRETTLVPAVMIGEIRDVDSGKEHQP